MNTNKKRNPKICSETEEVFVEVDDAGNMLSYAGPPCTSFTSETGELYPKKRLTFFYFTDPYVYERFLYDLATDGTTLYEIHGDDELSPIGPVSKKRVEEWFRERYQQVVEWFRERHRQV